LLNGKAYINNRISDATTSQETFRAATHFTILAVVIKAASAAALGADTSETFNADDHDSEEIARGGVELASGLMHLLMRSKSM
jgi:hypothetical protein